MNVTSARLVVVAAVLLIGGCGGGGRAAAPPATPSPTPAADREEAVIRAWSDALRKGDVELASRSFALPAVVANGTPPLRLTRRAEIRRFNAALPCGARLLATVRHGGRLIAKFRLTERPGGACGQGTGALAYTRFAIVGDRIVEWIRVEPGSGAGGTRSESV